jgi:RNA 2',3'-cyclic 3'-phosphodiesterase
VDARVGKRLFIAVDIDEATRAQVSTIATRARELIGPQIKASWVRTDRLHLTLQFLGQVDERVEQRVRKVLAAPIRSAPFDATFDGLGYFPNRGSPRVLWLGINGGLEQLRALYAAVGGKESFTPHLTLARFRDRVPRRGLARIEGITASAGPSRIDRVTLYESRLSPAGPTYVPLATAPLQP